MSSNQSPPNEPQWNGPAASFLQELLKKAHYRSIVDDIMGASEVRSNDRTGKSPSPSEVPQARNLDIRVYSQEKGARIIYPRNHDLAIDHLPLLKGRVLN